jgi:hypothetical protein
MPLTAPRPLHLKRPATQSGAASPLWGLRLSIFLLAALTAASTSYWALKWFRTSPGAPTTMPMPASVTAPDPLVVAQLLGGGGAPGAVDSPGPLASHFKLSGVVLDPAHGGYALIAVDAQEAKPYRVGDTVAQALVLHSVTRRSAALARGADAAISVTLELPEN